MLLGPVVGTLGVLLTLGLIAICVVERHDLRRLPRSSLFQRWLIWLVIAPVYTLAVLSGGFGVLLLTVLLVGQGLREYSRLVGLPSLYAGVLLAMGLVFTLCALVARGVYLVLPPLLLIVGTLQPLLTQDVRAGTRHLAFAALGFGYLAWLLSFIILVHQDIPGGPGILLVLGLAIAFSDVGAFVVGGRLGGPRLAPLLSPNKSWSGVAGNVLGAYFGVVVLRFALPSDSELLLLATLPLIVAIGAVWGDLLESLMKREFGLKDAGAWLPGFGGLLDRIDSLIVVMPLAYAYLRLIMTWNP